MKIPNRRVVQAELVDEDEANISPQDTEPHGGTHEVPDQVSEHQWVPGDPFYDDQRDPFAYDPSEDLDRPDDERGDEDHYSDYTAEDERQKKVQAFLVESGYDAQFVPPWSPVPTALGKAFITQNRDAQIDIVFPTVYEEDRTAKIKDLATAQALETITHHRMSEQIAKEMGFENYEYDEEQEQIKDEKKQSEVGSTATAGVGIADDLASTTIGLDVGPGGEITPKKRGSNFGPGGGSTGPQPIGAPAPSMAAEDSGKKRGELSNASTAQWKKYQGRNYESQQSSVKRIIRDKRGLITKIIEE
jgi:hypothetical protein